MTEDKKANEEIEFVVGEVVTDESIEDIKKKYMERGKGLIPEDLMQDFDFDVSFFVGMNYDLDRESERQVRAFDLALDLLEQMHSLIPVVFDDIYEKYGIGTKNEQEEKV